CRADYEVSLAKLQKTLQATKVKKASAKQVKELFSVEGLCIGPTQLPVGTEVVADYSVTSVINGITGANEPSLFNQFVKPERDFAVHQYADLRYVQEGEEAPNGQGVVQFANGIDIGKSMNLFVETDEEASIAIDRKSTRLNSSHVSISYAVFCLKKKKRRADRDESRSH